MKITEKPANVIVPILLFILFTPGLFFKAIENSNKYITVTVHAILFGLSYALLLTVFPNYY